MISGAAGASSSPAHGKRFAAVYEAQWPALHRRALALCHDASMADDITQEVFVRLLTATREGWWPDNVGGWLNRVATNLAISQFRRQAVATRGLIATRAELNGSHRSAARSAEDVTISREGLRITGLAFKALGADAQTALRLAGHGYSRADIAKRLGRSEAATRTLICRARITLRARTGAASPAVPRSRTRR
jgi:RNA polymerase sigma factor (sigma-70 family)